MTQYQPLFLKYRPQALSDLVGQEYVARALTNAVKHNRIFHAYLFTGPRGTGKTSSARILAKSLNCAQGPTISPCQVCASCEEIRQGISSSVFEIDAASNNSVDDARLLIERAPLVAQGGRYKVYIIDECHMLTKEAFNALLKTIEEPPPNVVFVLATTEEQKVPSTIVSRCQRLMFRLVNQEVLNSYMHNIASKEGISIESDAIDLIARRSGGGMRDALGLLDQASLFGAPGQPVKMADLLLLAGALNEDILSSLAENILDSDGEAALKLVGQLLEEGREPYLVAFELAKHFLNLAKASYVKDGSDPETRRLITGSPGYIDRLITASRTIDRAEISQIVELLDRLEQICKRSSQPALNLEIGLLSLCHRLDITELRSLNERVSALEGLLQDTGPLASTALGKPPARSEHHGARRSDKKVGNPAEPSSAPGQLHDWKESQPGGESPKPPQISALDSASNHPTTSPESQICENNTLSPVVVPEAERLGEASVVASTPLAAVMSPPGGETQHVVDSVIIENIENENEAHSQLSSEVVSPVENVELETLWSELLDELKKRNIPTFSLVSTHAFPLSISEAELTIGVLVEHFQKMIEAKLDHIKASLEAVCDKRLHVRVKLRSVPMTGEVPKARGSGKSEGSVRADQDQTKTTKESPSKISGEQASYMIGASAQPSKLNQEDNNKPAASADLVSESQTRDPLTRSAAQTILQEAYKLFEGPGSRVIHL
jgi:DNA polymerase III subunit gamma/tau